jgi:hypothetical protein
MKYCKITNEIEKMKIMTTIVTIFDPIKKIKNKKLKKLKNKIQNTRGYTRRKPRRLSKLVVKDQNNK